MNPLKWLRWKVLFVFALIFAALMIFGMNPLAQWRINDAGAASRRARWAVEDVDLGILQGDFALTNLLVSTAKAAAAAVSQAAATGAPDAAGAGTAPPNASDSLGRVFSAVSTRMDFSVDNLLRRRLVVDEIAIDTPRLSVQRRPDGSTNIGDLGGEPAPAGEEPPKVGEPERETDWVETVKKWYERLERIRKHLPGKGGETPDGGPVEKGPDPYSRRATFPFADQARFIVRRVVARGLEVQFSDSSPGAQSIPPLTDGTVELTGVSSSPAVHDDPIELALKGLLAGSQVSLSARVDLRKDAPSYHVDLDTGALPAGIVSAFAGKSIPVTIDRGAIRVSARVQLDGDEKLLVKPLLSFQGVQLGAKDPAGKIAGVDASQFVKAFNEASGFLGEQPIDIADLEISGTLSNPQFRWGDTVKNLVVQGGKAFAQAQLHKLEEKAQEVIDKGTEKVRDVLEKESGKLKEKIGEKLEKEIGDSPAGKELKKDLDKLIPKLPGAESGDAAKKSVDSLKKGLFDALAPGKKSGSSDKKQGETP